GAYDTATLRAAADCGIAAVVLSRVTVRPDGRLGFAHGPQELGPGDIGSVPSGRTGGTGGTGETGGARALALAQRTARLLAELESRGLRVANPEDYWGAWGPAEARAAGPFWGAAPTGRARARWLQPAATGTGPPCLRPRVPDPRACGHGDRTP